MKKIIFLLALLGMACDSFACSNLLVTRGASKKGTPMVTYTADSYMLYGELYHYPAKKHPKGAMRDVYEWDNPGKLLGRIPEAAETYNVIGNMNQYQLVITETTFGGREELGKPNGIIDYGSLIFITLQRAKTAREAIKMMAALVSEYGYASSGESFSIADKDEVWIMELIGKGEKEKGAVWVAMRIPDGYVSGHANQARITKFPLDDPENCLYSKDVISFAKKQGYFNGKNADFDFSAAYNPINFSGVRFCDARVWSMFNRLNPETGRLYAEYASGRDLSLPRMPLWIKPDEKLDERDAMKIMRDHYEGTPFDFTEGLGSGAFGSPYRNRPLEYKIGEENYFNERPISTQQTGYSIVAQVRPELPDVIGGVLWFGVDDTYMTCYTPVYTSSTSVAGCLAQGNGDLISYSPNAAFWVFNRVSQFVYPRYNLVIDDVKKKQDELESLYIARLTEADRTAARLYAENHAKALAFVTEFSVRNAEDMVAEWGKLENYLLVKYMDGIRRAEKNGGFERNDVGDAVPPINPGYSQKWLETTKKIDGNRYMAPK